MERKNVYIVIFIITTIIASCVAVYFAINSNNEISELEEKVDKLTAQNTTSTNDVESKEEVIEKVEQNVESKEEVEEDKLEVDNTSKLDITEQEALNIANDIYKKAYDVFETKSDELNNYFTKKAMSKYESWKMLHSDSLYMSTIFSHTGKKIRPLSIVTYTNDEIIVRGQITTLAEGERTVKVDSYPYYLILVKENGKWLIDCFE